MGSIKLFDTLFGAESFPRNVRAVDELKGIAAQVRQEPPAARAALGDLAPGDQHRARRLPHRRRGRGQRRRGRLDDRGRGPRRDRRDLRPPRRRDRPGLLDRGLSQVTAELAGKVAIVTGGAGGLGRGDRRAASSRRAPGSSSPTSTPSAARRWPTSSATRPRSSATDVADADEVQALVDFAVERFGGLHVMFNNAGIGGVVTPLPRRRPRATSTRVMARQPLRRRWSAASARPGTWPSTAAARSSTPRRSPASTPGAG